MKTAKLLKHLIIIVVELLIICGLLVGISYVKSKKGTSSEKTVTEASEKEKAEKGKKKDKKDKKKDDDTKEESGEVAFNSEGDALVTIEDDPNANGSGSIFSYPHVDFNPHCVESTKPTNLLLSTEIAVDDSIIDKSAYKPAGEIEFIEPEHYSEEVQGVVTFRGNNFRDNPTYGYANIKEGSMEAKWDATSGSISVGEYCWSGSGWTGQPLIMKWPREVKQHMNMTDEAKNDDDLVEVIYACMDGNVYFLNLRTGEKTRETLSLGITFKGSGALDPRGYPIMYVGAGYDNASHKSQVYVINLLDCSVMYNFGCIDSFSLRGALSFFDSSALVDAETDTLIYPGENGILYQMKLNTYYNKEAGTLSINPSNIVKWRYRTTRNTGDTYWLGMEDSCAIYGHYLYVADNGGNLFCIDLRTMETVWVQDTLDDTNDTPVLSIEDGKVYLYISTSFHLGWRSNSVATIPIWKIDAETGEIVWQVDYQCETISGVSGGVQSTIACGHGDLEDFIYVTVAMTHGTGGGDFVCIRKDNGEKAFEKQTAYSWSSPVCVYNEDGSGRVFYATADGRLYQVNGLTGEEISHIALSDGTIEASPAVYENMLVIGTRSGKIYGIELK